MIPSVLSLAYLSATTKTQLVIGLARVDRGPDNDLGLYVQRLVFPIHLDLRHRLDRPGSRHRCGLSATDRPDLDGKGGDFHNPPQRNGSVAEAEWIERISPGFARGESFESVAAAREVRLSVSAR